MINVEEYNRLIKHISSLEELASHDFIDIFFKDISANKRIHLFSQFKKEDLVEAKSLMRDISTFRVETKMNISVEVNYFYSVVDDDLQIYLPTNPEDTIKKELKLSDIYKKELQPKLDKLKQLSIKYNVDIDKLFDNLIDEIREEDSTIKNIIE